MAEKASAVQSLPEELGRAAAFHQALEAGVVEAAFGHQLGYLGMMAEGIDRPTQAHVYPQLVLAVLLAVQDLADERLARGDVDIRHGDHPAADFEASGVDHLLEELPFFRVGLQKGFDVAGLIEDELHSRVSPHELEGADQVGIPDFQGVFLFQEDFGVVMGVGDDKDFMFHGGSL